MGKEDSSILPTETGGEVLLRLNPFSYNVYSYPYNPGDSLEDKIDEAFLDRNIDPVKHHELFHIVFNGCIIDYEYVAKIRLKKGDTVLISPIISGGDFGQTFRQAAAIAVTIAAFKYAPVLGITSKLGVAGFVAGATIGSRLLLNSLIPPPQPPGLGSIGSNSGGLETSQMFRISGQSNQIKRFGTVPKVYGTFRIYPTVAATPYIDIEVDPTTGKTVQVLYAIYDFGLGPMLVDDIKIGDTLIENFDDVSLNLVDPNLPTTATGFWDNQLSRNFNLYKGDVELESVGFEFTQNSTEIAADPGNFEVIRTGPINVESVKQEIVVLLSFPEGLNSLRIDGTVGYTEVQFKIEYRLVGEATWRPFNLNSQVDRFSFTGKTTPENQSAQISLLPGFFTDTSTDSYNAPPGEAFIGTYFGGHFDRRGQPGVILPSFAQYTKTISYYGYKKGTQTITVFADTSVQLGRSVYYLGQFLGNVAAQSSGTFNGQSYLIVTLDRPLNRDIISNITEEIDFYEAGLKQFSIRQTKEVSFQRDILGNVYVRGSTGLDVISTAQEFASIRFTPKQIGQIEVRVRRTRTISEFDYQVRDRAILDSITTRFQRPPIQTEKRHVFAELKIRATNQLNGNIDNLNAVCTSALEVYDDSTETWSYELTSNPAWVIADLLIGDVNSNAVDKNRLDLESFVEYADYASQVPTTPPTNVVPFKFPRFSTNFILDFETNVRDLINLIGGANQATLNINEGKYGLLIDQLKNTPVQIFTPRNYRNFNSTRSYGEQPDAVEVKYNDPARGYRLNTQIVYEDGFDATNAVNIEELESFGVTNIEQAWRFGRYSLSQNKLRQENITIDVDFEYLVCNRGDYVQFTQDSMAAGGTPCRVKDVTGSTITVDDGIETDVSKSYGYIFRASDGTIVEDTLTVVDSDEFTLDGTLPAVGDLIVIGEINSIAIDCIVKSIIPQNSMTATLTLVEKADGVFDSLETGETPDYQVDALTGVDTENTAPGEVRDLQVTANTFFFDSDYRYYIDLTWLAGIGAIASYEVYVNIGGDGYKLVDVITETNYRYFIESVEFLGREHEFKILAVSPNGRKLNLVEVGSVSATPEAKSTPPSDVVTFNIDVTDQVITLNWDLVPDTDIQYYLIRYNPTTNGTWFTSTRLTETDRNTNTTSVQARVGTYLIKAYDFAGNESANATLAVTSIPELNDLNVVDEVNDADITWPSTKENVELQGSALILSQNAAGEYFNEGFYYYNSFVNLGEIYTVRIQNLIEAEGYREGDLMSEWTTLSSIDPISSTTTSDWDVELQLRYRESLTVMSNWSPLSDVTRLNEGDVDEWSDWKKLQAIGDFTGRLFQFRLRFISNIVDVTPRVTDGLIKLDMPDRVERDDNIVSGTSTYSVNYSAAFAGPGTTPNIQVSYQSANTGDYYIITNRTLSGFDITFYDSSDTIVSRTFDYSALGYGRINAEVIL